MKNNIISIKPALEKKKEQTLENAHQDLLRNNLSMGFKLDYSENVMQTKFHFGYLFLDPDNLDVLLKRYRTFISSKEECGDKLISHMVFRDHLIYYAVGSLEDNEMGSHIAEGLSHVGSMQIPLEYDFRDERGNRPFRYTPAHPELHVFEEGLSWVSWEPPRPDLKITNQPVFTEIIPIEVFENIRNSMD